MVVVVVWGVGCVGGPRGGQGGQQVSVRPRGVTLGQSSSPSRSMVDGSICGDRLADVVPPLCHGGLRAGLVLQPGGRRGIAQCLWHREVVLRSYVNPPHWCVGSRPQLTSWCQRTCPRKFPRLGWSVGNREKGERVLVMVWVWNIAPPSAELWWAWGFGQRALSPTPSPLLLCVWHPHSPPSELTWFSMGSANVKSIMGETISVRGGACELHRLTAGTYLREVLITRATPIDWAV